MIRIANGQGFWGDWLEAPVRLMEQGPIDYLTLDYLAEVTMSVLQKQRQADPELGYARDFPPLMARLAKDLKRRNVRVIANAGGVNPNACASMVRRLAPDLKVAVVQGDNVLGRIDDLLARGHALANLDTAEPLAPIRHRVMSANVYIGAFPLAEALAAGADVVITGRCADAALAMGPMIHAFHWKAGDIDLLAAGAIAGHIIECGPQCTGGNSQVDWETTPDFAEIGYPILEVEPSGVFVVTKHPGTGGRVDSHTVKEQMLYEIGDPKRYITPDVIADFTSPRVEDCGPARVRVTGCKGAAAPETLKVSISYHAGWKAVGTLVYSWPQAREKSMLAERIVRERLAALELRFDEIYAEHFGVDACHGPAAPHVADPTEVMLRIGVRGEHRADVDRFTRELIPLVLSGPPSATGYGEGRPPVREVVAYWPALLPRSEVASEVEVFE
jgi:hypothetical protein